MDRFSKLLSAVVILVSAFHFLPRLSYFFELNRISQPTGFIRDLTETEKAKLYLFQKVRYEEFRKLRDVVFCESQWNITAFNDTTKDGGLFQINIMHIPVAQAKGLEIWNSWKDNIDFAVDQLYRTSGLLPWSASRDCWSNRLTTRGR